MMAEPLGDAGFQLTGWIGTVKSPRFLMDEEGENLNRIAVFMRGKLAQEDVLDDFGQKEIYADYVVGEVYCDGLDSDEEDDIATSSRQSLKYDDPRFEAVRQIIYRELRHIAGCWSDWRRGDGAKTVAGAVPEVAEWLEELKGDTRRKAERWIGRLNVIRSDEDMEKRELLKASILAFESYRRKEDLDFLDNLTDQSIEPILKVFNDIDDLELSYYGQIVKLRLGVINTLEEKSMPMIWRKSSGPYIRPSLVARSVMGACQGIRNNGTRRGQFLERGFQVPFAGSKARENRHRLSHGLRSPRHCRAETCVGRNAA